MSYTVVRKASTTTRTLTDTLADDPELSVSLTAGQVYRIRGLVALYGHSVGDFKWRVHFTNTLEHDLTWLSWRQPSAMPQTSSESPGSAFAGGRLTDGTTFIELAGNATASHRGFVAVDALIKPAVTGTFSFQWAQFSSTANNAQVFEGSWLVAEEVTTNDTGSWSCEFDILLADTADSSTTTLTDTGLSVTLEANSTYLLEVRALVHGGATDDVGLELNTSTALHADEAMLLMLAGASNLDTEQTMGGMVGSIMPVSTAIGVAGADGTIFKANITNVNPTGYMSPQYFMAFIKTGAVAPTIKLRFAQYTAGAEACRVHAGSHMIAEKVA